MIITKELYDKICKVAVKTGSRMMGVATPKSDYDLVITVEEAVHDLGFDPDDGYLRYIHQAHYDRSFVSLVFALDNNANFIVNIIIVENEDVKNAFKHATSEINKLPKLFKELKHRRLIVFEWFMLEYFETKCTDLENIRHYKFLKDKR